MLCMYTQDDRVGYNRIRMKRLFSERDNRLRQHLNLSEEGLAQVEKGWMSAPLFSKSFLRDHWYSWKLWLNFIDASEASVEEAFVAAETIAVYLVKQKKSLSLENLVSYLECALSSSDLRSGLAFDFI